MTVAAQSGRGDSDEKVDREVYRTTETHDLRTGSNYVKISAVRLTHHLYC